MKPSRTLLRYSFLTLLSVAFGLAARGRIYTLRAPQQPSSIVNNSGSPNTRVVQSAPSHGLGAALTHRAFASPSTSASFRQERVWLLMLGAMSYMYGNLKDEPSPGYDISAAIAWDVDDPNKTPAFVFNRNRNYEKQGEIYHAEINTLRTAYEKMHHFDVPPTASDDERQALYKDDFKNAVLYTTLEPCPMCLTTMILAKVPSAIFCMDDPGLRDMNTHQTSINVPTAFYGRKFAEKRTDLPICRNANRAMWRTVQQSQPTPGNGPSTTFSITSYIHDKRVAIFKPAWDELRCYKIQYPEDEGLLSALQKATGDTSACK